MSTKHCKIQCFGCPGGTKRCAGTAKTLLELPPGLHPCNLSQMWISPPRAPNLDAGGRGGGKGGGKKRKGKKAVKITLAKQVHRMPRPGASRATKCTPVHVSSPKDERNNVFYNVWLTCMPYLIQFIKKRIFDTPLLYSIFCTIYIGF